MEEHIATIRLMSYYVHEFEPDDSIYQGDLTYDEVLNMVEDPAKKFSMHEY